VNRVGAPGTARQGRPPGGRRAARLAGKARRWDDIAGAPTPERPLSPWVINTVSQRARGDRRGGVADMDHERSLGAGPGGPSRGPRPRCRRPISWCVPDKCAHRHRRLAGGQPTLKASFWVVGACRVDVEIDEFDAVLWLVVTVTGMPRSIAQTNISHLREPEATPLTSGRQTLLALAAKLIGQRLLLPLRVAKNDGAELATAPIVRADDLFPGGHCLFEQLVSGA